MRTHLEPIVDRLLGYIVSFYIVVLCCLLLGHYFLVSCLFATAIMLSSSRSHLARVAVRQFVRRHQPARLLPAVSALSLSQQQQQHQHQHQHQHAFSTAAKPSVSAPDMFCRQCEQTKDHFACTTVGVCGKTAETAACQDALMVMIQSVSLWCKAARAAGISEQDLQKANEWTLAAAFSTLTNVNFSDERIAEYIQQGQALQMQLRQVVPAEHAPTSLPLATIDWSDCTTAQLEEHGYEHSVPVRQAVMQNDDAFCLHELCTYGLKGLCAYAAHCVQLGKMDAAVMTAVHEINSTLAAAEPDVPQLLATAMKVGQTNAQVLAMLDGAHAEWFGAPEPSPVRTTAVEGKCILVSGHDMMDLYTLLQQTAGTGIHVYTHGEMLPAHGYPKLREFKHLVGNYGTAWQNQKVTACS